MSSGGSVAVVGEVVTECPDELSRLGSIAAP